MTVQGGTARTRQGQGGARSAQGRPQRSKRLGVASERRRQERVGDGDLGEVRRDRDPDGKRGVTATLD